MASKIDIRLAVTSLLPFDGSPVLVKCPVHKSRLGVEDDKGSMAVYKSNVKCYGCDFYTTPKKMYASLALILGLWDGISDDYGPAMAAKAVSSKYIDDGKRPTPNQNRATSIKSGTAIGAAKFLWNYKKDRMLEELIIKRGFTKAIIRKADLGHDGTRFTIPIYDKDGEFLTMRYRRDDRYGTTYPGTDRDIPKYSGVKGQNKPVLYPMNLLQEAFNGRLARSKSKLDLYITEGEFDSLAFWSRGVPAITISNGAGQLHNIPEFLLGVFGDRIAGLVRLVICSDSDARGVQARTEIGITATRLGFETIAAILPEHVKDACELSGKYGDKMMDHIRYEEI